MEDEESESESTEEEANKSDVFDEIFVTSNHSKKSKPSYHNQYNRRERSPITQKLLKEFTQNPETKLFYCNFCRNSYRHKQTVRIFVHRHVKRDFDKAFFKVERHLSREHDRRKTEEKTGNFSLEAETKIFYCNICKNGYKVRIKYLTVNNAKSYPPSPNYSTNRQSNVIYSRNME